MHVVQTSDLSYRLFLVRMKLLRTINSVIMRPLMSPQVHCGKVVPEYIRSILRVGEGRPLENLTPSRRFHPLPSASSLGHSFVKIHYNPQSHLEAFLRESLRKILPNAVAVLNPEKPLIWMNYSFEFIPGF